jgi:hypothetical protein
MENNQAFVAFLKHISKIEGADRIVRAEVVLNSISVTSVVVGADTQDNTPVVYFDSNLCVNQDAIDTIDKQSPDYGKEGFLSLGNYLSKGNRVRCIRLKQTISNGLAVNIEKFYKFFKDEEEAKKTLVEGFSFTEINGKEICKKWLPPARNVQGAGKKKGRKGKVISRVIPEQFHFHIDTDMLLRNVHRIDPEQIISISRKMHGTSAICSNALVKRNLNLFEKALKFLKIKIVDTEHDYLYASRTVVKNGNMLPGFYKVDVWSLVGKKHFYGRLKPGETIYYEIVGYIPETQTFIQKGYDYGCKEGEYKIAVYRITTTDANGNIVEYSWDQIKSRCRDLDVPMVEEYYYGKAKDMYPELSLTEHWKENFVEKLRVDFLEKDCVDCVKKVPDEGIVLRNFSTGAIEVFKLKSEKFYLHESKAMEEEVLDIEAQEGAIV